MANKSAPLPRSEAGNAKAPAGEPDERGPASKVPEGDPEKEAAKSSRTPVAEDVDTSAPVVTFVIENGVARLTDDAEAIANAPIAISVDTGVIRDKMQFSLISRPLEAWLLNNAYPPRV